MSEEQPVTDLINSEENVDGLVLSGKRERRKPEQFSVSMTPAKTPKKDVKYQGSGTQLIENDAFCKHLDKHKGDDELIKLIHRLLFGTEGRKAEAKKNIRKFSGFSPGTVQTDVIEKVSAKKAWTVSLLKSFAEMLGLEKGGGRDALIERIVEFLMCPGLPAKKGSAQKRPRSSEKAPKAKKAKVVEDEDEGKEDDEEEEVKEEEKGKEGGDDDAVEEEEPKEEVKEKPKPSKAKKSPKAVKAAKDTKKGSKKGKAKKEEAKEEEEKAAVAVEEDEGEKGGEAEPVVEAAVPEDEVSAPEEAAPVEEAV